MTPRRIRSPSKHARKDFDSDQDVRWCPGCGDYSILANVQKMHARARRPPREHRVRLRDRLLEPLPVLHEHLRVPHASTAARPAIATGLKVARPELHVWVVTGDGDGLSIGGNHLMHALRRNVDLKILLFNNRIYGLTKGQYSPTSEVGKVTKSTPFGSSTTRSTRSRRARRRRDLRRAHHRHRPRAT